VSPFAACKQDGDTYANALRVFPCAVLGMGIARGSTNVSLIDPGLAGAKVGIPHNNAVPLTWTLTT